MAEHIDDLIIVRDGEGRFYAFTPEQWAEARVPEDVQAALDEMFEGDDTRGLMAAPAGGQGAWVGQVFTSLLQSFADSQQRVIQDIGR